jgi:lipopolysaccharide export system protein LptC
MNDRFAVYLSILILAALAGTTYWAARQARLAAAVGPDKPVAHEPDFFVERFVTLKTDVQGLPTYRLVAEKMVHYPDDDSTHVSRPRTLSLGPQRPHVTVEAEQAQLSAAGDRVDLAGNVKLVRAPRQNPDGRTTEELVIRSAAMTLFPDDDKARSDRAVQIDQGRSRLNGKGMEYDNLTRVLQVHSASRMVIAPRDAAPPAAPSAPADQKGQR